MENIFSDLKTHQLGKSVRGAVGGYTFAKDPSEITIAQIMRVVDGPIALISCVSEGFYEACAEWEETCRIRKLFCGGQSRNGSDFGATEYDNGRSVEKNICK